MKKKIAATDDSGIQLKDKQDEQLQADADAKTEAKQQKKRRVSSNAIATWKQEEMYAVYQQNPSIRHVARVCGIALGTVRRYKQLNQWDQKLALALQHETEGTPDQDGQALQVMKKQILGELDLIRAKARNQVLSKNFKNSLDATKAYLEATKLQLALRGQVTDTKVSLLIIAGQRFLKRMAQDKEPAGSGGRRKGEIQDAEVVE